MVAGPTGPKRHAAPLGGYPLVAELSLRVVRHARFGRALDLRNGCLRGMTYWRYEYGWAQAGNRT